MSKTILTAQIENAAYHTFNKTGSFIAYEVIFGFHQWENRQLVDVAIYNTNKELTCVEIKVTKSDFHSKAKKTFVGHKNYYAMPTELYEQVKDEIPNGIGVYTFDGKRLICVKRAKTIECQLDENTILWSIIRSRTNWSTVGVKERTKLGNKTINAIHKHLELLDIENNKVSLEDYYKCKEYDKEFFISLIVSDKDYYNRDFYTILSFMENWLEVENEN